MRSIPFRLVRFVAASGSDVVDARAAPVAISGTVQRTATALIVDFRVENAADAINFAPSSAAPQRRDELWRTTCFELFARRAGQPGYWEYNMSPSGHWNAYRFSGYRAGMLTEQALGGEVTVSVTTTGAVLAGLRATLPLPHALRSGAIEIAISCVIEDRAGQLSYFALQHRPDKPDFHDPSGFILTLEPTAA